jgi:hypothetical protein
MSHLLAKRYAKGYKKQHRAKTIWKKHTGGKVGWVESESVGSADKGSFGIVQYCKAPVFPESLGC